MKELFNLLIEEVSLRSDVVHHTDLYGLNGILSSGFLMPSQYDTRATNADPKKGQEIRELSTLRRSMDRNIKSLEKVNAFKWEKEMRELTEKASGVKIYLFSNNILSSVRGVKRKPISEYGKAFSLSIEHRINLIYDKFLKDKMNNKDFENIIKDTGKKIFKSKGEVKVEDGVDEIISKIKVEEGNIKEELKNLLMMIFSYHKNQFHRPREGEERFIFFKDSSQGIPVDTKFMKIRITDHFNEYDIRKSYEEDSSDNEYVKKEMIKLKNNMIKYKKVFIVDKYYNFLIKSIDKFLKEDF